MSNDKREDDLYDDLIEDLGIKKERMIYMMFWLKILGSKKERMIYMMNWLKILGLKKRGWFVWWFDWRFWDQKREDYLYDDLIENLGIKNDKNIFFFIPQSVAMRFL